LVLEEPLGLIHLGRILTTGLVVNQGSDLVDSLVDLSFVAGHGTFDLFDDVHATSFLLRGRGGLGVWTILRLFSTAAKHQPGIS
jgi:hypothetical protein